MRVGDLPAKRTADNVYQTLRRQIELGELGPGSKLIEQQLAESLGVSRTPIREALRRLAAQGLLEYQTNRGSVVVQWRDQDVLEVLEIRAMLEALAARKATSVIGDQELDRLKELADNMEREWARGQAGREDGSDDDAFTHVRVFNREFHNIVADAGGGDRLKILLDQVLAVPIDYRSFVRNMDAQLRKSFAHHRELIEAFELRDPDWAESVMKNHVLASRAALVGARNHRNGDAR